MNTQQFSILIYLLTDQELSESQIYFINSIVKDGKIPSLFILIRFAIHRIIVFEKEQLIDYKIIQNKLDTLYTSTDISTTFSDDWRKLLSFFIICGNLSLIYTDLDIWKNLYIEYCDYILSNFNMNGDEELSFIYLSCVYDMIDIQSRCIYSMYKEFITADFLQKCKQVLEIIRNIPKHKYRDLVGVMNNRFNKNYNEDLWRKLYDREDNYTET